MTAYQVCKEGRGALLNVRCPKAAGCPALREGPAGQPKEVCGIGREREEKALVLALGAISTDTRVKAANRLAQAGGVSKIEPLAAACACWGREKMVPALRALVKRHGEEGLAELGRIAKETEGNGAYGSLLSVAQAVSAVPSSKAVDVLVVVAERAAQDEIYGKPPESTLWKDIDDFAKQKIDLRAILFDAVLTAVKELGVPPCSALVLGRIIDSPDALFYGIGERASALLS